MSPTNTDTLKIVLFQALFQYQAVNICCWRSGYLEGSGEKRYSAQVMGWFGAAVQHDADSGYLAPKEIIDPPGAIRPRSGKCAAREKNRIAPSGGPVKGIKG